MNILRYTAFILVLIGALNWGLVGLFGFDLVASIFGDMTLMSRVVYSLVGLSAIVAALTMRHCEKIENSCDDFGRCSY
jgi:uncharacterized membrane protein YuzA (DUF378 family)